MKQTKPKEYEIYGSSTVKKVLAIRLENNIFKIYDVKYRSVEGSCACTDMHSRTAAKRWSSRWAIVWVITLPQNKKGTIYYTLQWEKCRYHLRD
jgi:hypothetical protein